MKITKHSFHKLIAFLLTLSLLFSLAPSSASAEGETADADAPVIEFVQEQLGSSIEVSSSGEEALISFTPQADGYFRAFFSDHYGKQSIVTLYDSDKKYLAQNDYELNKELDYEMTGGQTYYFGIIVTANSGTPVSFTGTFTLKEMVWITFHANSDVNPTAFIYGENEEHLEVFKKLYERGTVFSSDVYVTDETNDFWEMGWSVDPLAADADPEIILDGEKDLYAVWISSEIEILFDANGGYIQNPYTHETEEQKVIRMSRDTITKPVEYFVTEPKHDNIFMIFEGWYSDPEAGEPVTEISLREGCSVYAHWRELSRVPVVLGQEVEIAYPGDGREILLSYAPSLDEERLALSLRDSTANPGLSGATVQYYNAYMQPNSYITGKYEADGLVLENLFLNKRLNDQEKQIYLGITIPSTESFTFKAQLDEQPKVPVHYHARFSFCTVKEKDSYGHEIASHGQDYTSYQYLHNYIDLSSFYVISDDERYDFLGWSTEPDSLEPVGSFDLEEEVDLYPVFTFKHKVVFHVNNSGSSFGDNTGVTEITQYYEDGTEFVGNTTQWWESYPFAHIDSDLGRPVTVLGLSENPIASVPDKNITIDSDKDLYVVWGNRVLVTFDINTDLTNAWYYSTSANVSTRQEALTPTESIADCKYGLTFGQSRDVKFLGWSEDPNATEPDPDLTARAGLTVYAVWQYKFYYINYDANADFAYIGSTGTNRTARIKQTKRYFDDSPYFQSYTYTNNNRFAVFLGWYDDPAAGKKYEEGDPIPDDLTVYAHWTIRNPITVSFDEWIPVEYEELGTLFSFVPEETAEYRILFDYGMDGNNYFSTTLYDSDMNSMEPIGSERLKWTVNSNKHWVYLDLELTGGETYYIETKRSDPIEGAPFRFKVFQPHDIKINITFDANDHGKFHVGTDYVTSYTKECLVGDTSEEWLKPKDNQWEYQFIGWSRDPNALDPDEDLILDENDTVIYAIYEHQYVSVTLHANEDTASFITTDAQTGLQKEVPEFVTSLQLHKTWNTDYFSRPDNSNKNRFLLGWSETPDGALLPQEIEPSKYVNDYYAIWQDLPSGTCGEDLTWQLSAAAYGNDRYNLIIKGSGNMSDYDSMEDVPWYEFRDKILSVTYQGSVTLIGRNAFHGCTRINQAYLPDTILRIGNYAFSGCSGLYSVLLPTSLEDLGLGAFESCSQLTSLYIPYNVTEIPSWLCRNCTGLRYFETPVDATRIGIDAFKGCTDLERIRLTDKITVIGDGAFDGTDKLKEIRLSKAYQSEDGSFGIAPERIAGLTVLGFKGQPSEKFVKDNGGTYKYVLCDDYDVLLAEAYDYTGEEVTPKPTIKYGDEVLIEGIDYELSYMGNIDIGSGLMIVTGIGNYADSLYINFRIREPKLAQDLSVSSSSFSLAVGKSKSITVSSSGGDLSYDYTSGNETNATVARTSTGYMFTAKKVGTVKVRITAAETAAYKAKSKTIVIKVVPAATSSLKAAAASTGVKLTWKKVTGAKGYKVYRGSTLLKTITSATTLNYTDTKAANGSTYTYKIAAYASTGDGTAKSVKTTFVSRPTPKLSTTSKKLKVSWSKNSKANGYEIWYGTNSGFKSGTYKKSTVSKNSTVSKTFTASSGKTYYVKMRTYKTVSGKKVYSAWSAVKKLKVK